MTNWIMNAQDNMNKKGIRLTARPLGNGSFDYMIDFHCGVMPSRYFKTLEEAVAWVKFNNGALGAINKRDMGSYVKRYRDGIVFIANEGGN